MPNGYHREVPVAALREAYERSGQTRAEVARRLGWYRSDRPNRADGSRFARAIGLLSVDFGHGLGPRKISSTSYERAVELARAIGVDPTDVGL